MSIYNLNPCHTVGVTSPSPYQGEGGGGYAAAGMRSKKLHFIIKRALIITISIVLFSQVSFSKENQIGIDLGFVAPLNFKTSGAWPSFPIGSSLNYQFKKTEFTFGINYFFNGYMKCVLPKFGIKYHFKTTSKYSNLYLEPFYFSTKWSWPIGRAYANYNYKIHQDGYSMSEIIRYKRENLEFNLGYEGFTKKYFSFLISTGIAIAFQRSIEEKWNQKPNTFYNTYFYFPFRFGIKFHIFNIKKRTHEPVEQNTGD